MSGAQEVIADAAIEQFVVTDSVPRFRLDMGKVQNKVDILSAAPLIAETIKRLHEGQGLTDLLVF